MTYRDRVEEATAEKVVELLRQRRIFAAVKRAGVYRFGVRVVVPDLGDAEWDTDGAAGLEAMVLKDGILVGYVPPVPDSDELDAEGIADVIASTDYRAVMSAERSAASTDDIVRASVSTPAPPSATTAGPARRGLLRRLTGR